MLNEKKINSGYSLWICPSCNSKHHGFKKNMCWNSMCPLFKEAKMKEATKTEVSPTKEAKLGKPSPKRKSPTSSSSNRKVPGKASEVSPNPKPRPSSKAKEKAKEKAPEAIKTTDIQRTILNLALKSKSGHTTYREVQDETGLPKARVCRIIKTSKTSLLNRGLVSVDLCERGENSSNPYYAVFITKEGKEVIS
jgi:hypothetical protein